jgi:hypothetical protein
MEVMTVFFLFFGILGFDLRVSFARQALYHSSNPLLLVCFSDRVLLLLPQLA